MLKTIFAFVKKWIKPPRSLHITKGGWKFLGLTLLVGFAAVNTGNNLLYLVLGLMLSFITASGVLSELMLRNVSITRTFPRHIFVRQVVPVTVTLTNRKKYVSSFSLVIEDLSQAHPPDHTQYILKIPARGSETLTYPMAFGRRGLHRPGKIKLSTRYPFGFFLKSATFAEMDEEILVYPQIEKLQPSDIPKHVSHAGEREVPQRGTGLEVHSIRDYMHGDGNTRIHWKSTAKLARLMTKEFEEEQQKKIALVLDISLPGSKEPISFPQDVELAISLAASYTLYFIKNDFQIQLITPMQKSPFDTGQSHLFRLLRVLALLQPSNGHSKQKIATSLQTLKRMDVMKILISANHLNGEKLGKFSKVVHADSTIRKN